MGSMSLWHTAHRAAANGTIQVHHITMVVSQNLHFDVPGRLHILLNEHAPIPKGCLSFVASSGKRVLQKFLCMPQIASTVIQCWQMLSSPMCLTFAAGSRKH